MKNIFLVIMLAVCSSAYAVDTNSVRGSTSFVERGSSYSQMLDVLGNPESSYNHVIHDRNGWPHKATSYIYHVDGEKYTITVVDGQIYKINWER
ncbi:MULTISPECIES: hypothetical protein [Acinetobacter]|uniref:DUF2845 domain-containing protein n=1 Tax=Acinetobacter sp. A1-4-2 TaxID=3156489 RepID=A0AAU7SZN2_9GAMM|nr:MULTISPECIES: hypothetical protein [Acinetobacter]NNH00208.1 hypothetical protein [Acinetobacter sp. ANC 5414]OTG70081.1 hypothetical protein B9T38_13765 [Acinetobacter sp. ANC 4218]